MNKLYNEGRIIKSGKTLYQKTYRSEMENKKRVLLRGGIVQVQLVRVQMKLKNYLIILFLIFPNLQS